MRTYPNDFAKTRIISLSSQQENPKEKFLKTRTRNSEIQVPVEGFCKMLSKDHEHIETKGPQTKLTSDSFRANV